MSSMKSTYCLLGCCICCCMSAFLSKIMSFLLGMTTLRLFSRKYLMGLTFMRDNANRTSVSKDKHFWDRILIFLKLFYRFGWLSNTTTWRYLFGVMSFVILLSDILSYNTLALSRVDHFSLLVQFILIRYPLLPTWIRLRIL